MLSARKGKDAVDKDDKSSGGALAPIQVWLDVFTC